MSDISHLRREALYFQTLGNEIGLRSLNVTAGRKLSDLLVFLFTDEEQRSKKVKRSIKSPQAGGSDNRTQSFWMSPLSIWGGKYAFSSSDT